MNLSDTYEERFGDLREQRCRVLGTRSPRCRHPDCDESDPLALTGTDPDILCHEHLSDRVGRDWTQEHHYGGRANSPEKGPIPANDHAAVSAAQSQWDRETLRNPDGSPLLRAAAAIRGWLDVLYVILERTVGWIPAALETLDRLLCERLGPRWWEDLGWQP